MSTASNTTPNTTTPPVLTPSQKSAIAYLKAWSAATPLLAAPESGSATCVEDVYDTHRAMIHFFDRHAPFLKSLAGYKMGGVGLVPTEECFYGPLFRAFVAATTTTSSSEGMMTPSISRINCHTLEAEIGFIMSRSPPPSDEPYTPSQVFDYIDSIVCSVELCGSRFSSDAKVSLLDKLADGLMTGGVVMGSPIRPEDWDGDKLKKVATSLKINGVERDSGSGERCPLGGPLESLTWLVNRLAKEEKESPGGGVVGGNRLKEGQLIISGMTCKVTDDDFGVGDEVEACFEGLGVLKFRLGE